MAVASFDTLKFARQLKQAGVPPEQAEAQADAMADALHTGIQDLATKADVKDIQKEIEGVRQKVELLKQELTSEIKIARQELRSEIQTLKAESESHVQALRFEIQSSVQALRSEASDNRVKLESEVGKLQNNVKNVESMLSHLRWIGAIIASAAVGIAIRFILFDTR